MLDQHGYVDADADRGDDEAAQPEHRVRQLAQVEPAAHRRQRGGDERDGGLRHHAADQRLVRGRRRAEPLERLCAGRRAARPAEAEGWDDWGPFYTAMYAQLVGLDASTVEMCTATSLRRPVYTSRAAARLADGQFTVATSTLAIDIAHRHEMLLHDMLENYRRGVDGAPRPDVLPGAVRRRQQLDGRVPEGVRDPASVPASAATRRRTGSSTGCSQRDRGATRPSRTSTFGGQTFAKGSYVVSMSAGRTAASRTPRSGRLDISSRISVLYAPPAAWSHGYLWGADIVTITARPTSLRRRNEIDKPSSSRAASSTAKPKRGRSRTSDTCWRSTRRQRCARSTARRRRADRHFARQPFTGRRGGPSRPERSSSARAPTKALDKLGKAGGPLVLRGRCRRPPPLPTLEPIDRVPRIAVLTGAAHPADLGRCGTSASTADPISTATLNTARGRSARGLRHRLQPGGLPVGREPDRAGAPDGVLRGGGGYIGGGHERRRLPEPRAAGDRSDGGEPHGQRAQRHRVVGNAGGATSPITGAYPAATRRSWIRRRGSRRCRRR